MNSTRKGQGSANSAAVVIILVAVMIILYILFLPPEDRAKLLGEDPSTGTIGGQQVSKALLLSKTPGRLYPVESNTVEHRMPSFLVFTATNANELKRTDNLYVKNSAFGRKNGEVIFFYDSTTTEDLKLSFNVVKGSGRLKVTLNNKDVFEGELDAGSPRPILIPKEHLLNKNTLIFEASSPGLVFWRINEYELESIVVSGKVTEFKGARGEQHFSISETEFEKTEKAMLQFLPDCPPREEGQLQVLINARPIYTTVPDCGLEANIEVSKDFLRPGDNTLVATTSKGAFLIDSPRLTTQLREQGQPVYYFTANPALLSAVFSGRRGLMMTIRFADSTTTKRGVLEVNGFKAGFDTQHFIFQTALDARSLLEGSNSVKIVPLSGPLDVVELRIEII